MTKARSSSSTLRMGPRFWAPVFRGQHDLRILYLVAIAVGSLGTFGELVLLDQQLQGDFTTGALLILIPNVVAGVIVLFGWDPLARPSTVRLTARQKKALRWWGFRPFIVMVAIYGLQAILALPAAIRLAIVGPWHDPTIALAPFLLAIVAVVGELAGMLVGLMIVLPIVTLVRALVDRISGSPSGAAVVPSALLMPLIAAVGVFAAVAPHLSDPRPGSLRYHGAVILVSSWLVYSGSPTELAVAWIARALEVLLVLDLAWIIRSTLAERKAAP